MYGCSAPAAVDSTSGQVGTAAQGCSGADLRGSRAALSSADDSPHLQLQRQNEAGSVQTSDLQNAAARIDELLLEDSD